MELRWESAKMNRIEDEEKFADMWLAGASGRDIAKEFGVQRKTVYTKRYRMGLPARDHSEELLRYRQRVAQESEQKIFDLLKECDGCCELNDLLKTCSSYALTRLVNKRKLFRVYISLKRTTGSYKRWTQDHLFKDEYFGKTFICLDRTSLVRLMYFACEKPQTPANQGILRRFLNRFLSDAEAIAVLWRLGIRKWSPSQKKRNIQIDGILFPQKRLGFSS